MHAEMHAIKELASCSSGRTDGKVARDRCRGNRLCERRSYSIFLLMGGAPAHGWEPRDDGW